MSRLNIRNFRRISALVLLSLALAFADSAGTASSKIGMLVFDGFLISNVTAPIKAFGATTTKADLSPYLQSDLDKVALRLNQRPRRRLNFRSPAEAFHEDVALTG